MEERVVLVDKNDVILGEMGKLEAHVEGVLHRAFSIFVFDDQGQVLIHQRAFGKYHSPGLWTNTCCSHPRPNESWEAACERKLMQEMGFVTEVKEIGNFIYRAEFDNGLTEHELDHVFVGRYVGEVLPNPEEVENFAWLSIDALNKWIEESPDDFTVWFKIILKDFSLSQLRDFALETK